MRIVQFKNTFLSFCMRSMSCLLHIVESSIFLLKIRKKNKIVLFTSICINRYQ